ncbi:MAG TPA: M48 family metalloprotease [Burkholderiaceae bacterium]|nr:M48 family metalloprotease [Burkholderiaceae bacterium]
MDFFTQQEHARRQTKTLVLLFALAVLAIVVAVNLALALIWIWANGEPLAGSHDYPVGFFATNTIVTLALIGGGSLIQSWNLRDGGDAVARMVGGRPLLPASRDLAERRLLNVVEEMALAAGIACPKVYLLDQEEAINAFAAGHNPNQAVIAVTRGALKRLNRDELQGVVGHEFSHILNGDMRLNVNLIGVLFGIQMVAGFGRTLMEFGGRVWGRRGRDEKGASGQAIVLAIGLVLFVVGYIGIFFGRLIKAAVSRQREFLADASAVQFTRNPDGIGGALRKIGGLGRNDGPGSRIDNSHAEQLSHLFLGAARPSLVNGWLATHPPLAERLRRIYGRGVEFVEAPEIVESAPAAEPMLADIPYFAPAAAGARTPQPVPLAAAAPTMALPAADAEQSVGAPPLPLQLRNAVREPQAACAVVYALLLGPASERPPQMALLQAAQPQQAKLAAWLAQALERLPKSARLPLLDLAMPALRQLSSRQQRILLETADQLIGADARVTLAEFVVQTILQRRLGAHAGRAVPVRFASLVRVRAEVALLLSLVAHVAAARPVEPPASAAVESAALQRFLRAAAGCPRLALTARDFTAASAVGFAAVHAALERANQLAPRAKPELVEAWLAVALDGQLLSAASADVLRALCAAIDAPIPAAVAASYADCFRGQA